MSKLENFLLLQQQRAVGNTTFMLKGLNFERKAVIFFLTVNEAREAMRRIIDIEQIPLEAVGFGNMMIGNVHFATIGGLANQNFRRYMGMAVMIDHHALEFLISKEREQWMKSATS